MPVLLKTIMPPPSGAGDLPLNEDLTGQLCIKTGNIQENPRRGQKSTIAVKVSDGFPVLRARVEGIVVGHGVPRDFILYFKRTKTAVQSEYQEMTADNFEEWLRARWAKITRAEVEKWQEEDGMTPQQKVVFEFFVYKPRVRQPRARQIQRATQGRIEAARDRIRQHDNTQAIQRGPIELEHLATVNARRPDDAELVLQANNTTIQARYLDQARQQLQNEDEQAAAARNSVMKPITIELNGTMVQVQVNVASLRTALGLPQHNLIADGIFHGYQHQAVAADEDQEDAEHENPQVEAVGVE